MPKEAETTPKAAKAAKAAKAKVYRPRQKEWHKTAAYRRVRASIEDAVAAAGLRDPLSEDRIEEYMALWCQRQALYYDVAKRGPTVVDDRGRVSENRSISLGVQVSKQMMALLAALGVAGTGSRSAPEEDDDGGEEDDPL